MLAPAFSERREFEAERLGVERAARAGFDPAGLRRFFERRAEEEAEEAPRREHRDLGNTAKEAILRYEATHPHMRERAERLRALEGKPR